MYLNINDQDVFFYRYSFPGEDLTCTRCEKQSNSATIIGRVPITTRLLPRVSHAIHVRCLTDVELEKLYAQQWSNWATFYRKEMAQRLIDDLLVPVVVEGYDPKCTCGSLIPQCPTCSEVEWQWHEKRADFAREAPENMQFLLDFIQYRHAKVIADAS